MGNFTIGIAMNAFKGSLSALEAAQAVAQGLTESSLQPQIKLLPLADGGDGTLDVMLSQAGSRRLSATVQNPLGENITADYGFLADGETAVIEMARASGLALVAHRRAALSAHTFGTGQLIQAALNSGAKRIILGVGGSATTDGGAGCLAALGVGLVGCTGYGGGALGTLERLEIPPRFLEGVEISVLCDVDNPPIGEKSAARVFAPQKGADAAMVETLEANLSHFFGVIAAQTGNDVRSLAGGGAAGAIAGGLAALAGARLVPGAATIIAALGYDALLADCDLIITGEGALDAQTEHGKAPAVIAARAAARGVPTIALAGSIPPTLPRASHLRAAFSLMHQPASLEEALTHSAAWLASTARNIGALIALSKKENP